VKEWVVVPLIFMGTAQHQWVWTSQFGMIESGIRLKCYLSVRYVGASTTLFVGFYAMQCESEMALRQGGYTYRMQGLTFINTTRRIRWTRPYKEIVQDLDGSLTGIGGGGWVSPYYKVRRRLLTSDLHFHCCYCVVVTRRGTQFGCYH
jgi:hypothetical protein